MNPLDLDGPTFLGLYFLLLMLAGPIGWLLPKMFRPAGRTQTVSDPDTLGYLAGRSERFAEGVTARLVASGAIEVESKHFLRGTGEGATPAERAVLALAPPFGWRDIVAALRPESAALERRLVSSGLLSDRSERRRLAMVALAPYAALLLIGMTKLFVGLARGKPVLFLGILLVLTLIPMAIRWGTIQKNDQTRAGRAALKAARRQHERLRRAPTTRETGLAVALFGPTVLAGSAFAAFYHLRHPASSSSSDSSSSGCSSGDSGCGGSGCGGCSGGGD